MSDLIKAIRKNNFEQVQQLIAQGADVNKPDERGTYPVILAVRNVVDKQILDILIRNSANVNVAEADGRTAILFAVGERDEEAIRSLVAAGADLNRFYKDFDGDEKTVLMFACEDGRIEIVRLLLDGGADPNQKSTKGNTALMFSALTYEPDILVLLLRHGADLSLTNNQGQTAYDLCKYDDCRKILTLVEEPEYSEELDEPEDMDMLDDDEVPEDDPEMWTAEELFSYDKAVYSVAFNPERTEFMVGNTVQTLPSLFERSDLTIRQPITEPFSTSVAEVVYTPDGQFIVLAAKRFGAVVKSRQQDDVRFFNENGSEVTCVDVSPDSKKFLSASKDKIIRLWDIETGSLIRRFSDHKDNRSNIERVRFSPDGEHFASVADDIIIWSMVHGHMKTIKGNGEDKLTTFAYSPDGNRIASLAGTNCFVWNVKNQLQLAFDLSGNGRELSEVAFTPDGKYILLARDEDAEGNNATINVCDALSGDLLSKLDGGISFIFSIAISKDNQYVLIGGMNEDEAGEVLLGKMSELLKPLANHPFPKQLEQTQLNVQRIRFAEEPDIFDALMAESYPLSEYQSENPDSIVFLTNAKNGFGYDRDQLRNMTIGAKDYYFKCLSLNERLVVALSNVDGETPYVLLRSAGTYYVPAEQLEAALDDDEHSIFKLLEYDVLPYTASIGVIEVSHAQRNHRGEQINVVSKDHCQAGSNKKAYEIIALDVQ
jgi:hypothetical protein